MSQKILLVDDDTHLLKSLALTLRAFSVDTESNPLKAKERLLIEDYAVVVSDLKMPGIDGMELLLASAHLTPNTIRIMLTGHGDLEIAMEAINRAQIYRFLTKPIEPKEMRSTISEALAEHKKLLDDQNIRESALRDELTGLANRTLFMDRLRHACANAARENKSVAVMFIDLDGFKEVNDTFGHEAGDEVLRVVGERIDARLRKGDTVARYGGDEFILFAYGVTGKDDVEPVVQTLLDQVVLPIEWGENTLSVGMSVGIALYPDDGDHEEYVIAAADKAMYKAKKAGGNRYEWA
ncbi:MAG: diguanylate cyclase domain-containing protein [Desulfovibrio sp.]